MIRPYPHSCCVRWVTSLLKYKVNLKARLVDVNSHRSLLDRFAGAGSLAATTRQAYKTWRDLNIKLNTALKLEKARADEEWLRDAVSQLDDLSPEADEEGRLAEERQMLANVSKIAEVLSQVEGGIAGESGVIYYGKSWEDRGSGGRTGPIHPQPAK